eukprot:PhF_6_TR19812/c0_g1_i1/m.28888
MTLKKQLWTCTMCTTKKRRETLDRQYNRVGYLAAEQFSEHPHERQGLVEVRRGLPEYEGDTVLHRRNMFLQPSKHPFEGGVRCTSPDAGHKIRLRFAGAEKKSDVPYHSLIRHQQLRTLYDPSIALREPLPALRVKSTFALGDTMKRNERFTMPVNSESRWERNTDRYQGRNRVLASRNIERIFPASVEIAKALPNL